MFDSIGVERTIEIHEWGLEWGLEALAVNVLLREQTLHSMLQLPLQTEEGATGEKSLS